MSLEETLNRHTAAIETLSKSVDSLAAVAGSLFAAVAPSATRPAAAPAQNTAAAVAAGQPAAPRGPGRPRKEAPSDTAQKKPGGVSYDLVREVILTLSELKGHQAAVSMLAKFDAKSGRDLKPDQYPSVIDAVRASDAAVITRAEEKLAARKPA